MAGVIISGDTSGSVTLQAPAVSGSTTLTLPTTSGTVLTTASSTGVSGSAISSGTVAEAYGGTGTNTGYYGFKNRIINGAMVIDQRNAGASVTPTNGQYLVDRWQAILTQSSKYSAQQNAGSVTPPAGYINYLGVTSLSAYSITSTDQFRIRQFIEGLNVADLAWGTANAATVTISFWVRSSLTGTFGGALQNSASNRSYPFSYTISSANTWEQKSVTVAGDTSGTWLTTNGVGIQLTFAFGVGSTLSGTAGAWAGTEYDSATGATSVVGTNGATWYITGVQLEKGSTATSFDYRPYGTELALCQRYYEKSYDTSVAVGTVTGVGAICTAVYGVYSGRPFLGIQFQTAKRTSATVTPYTPNTANTSGKIGGPSGADLSATIQNAGTQAFQIYQSQTTSSLNGDYYIHWIASAEL